MTKLFLILKKMLLIKKNILQFRLVLKLRFVLRDEFNHDYAIGTLIKNKQYRRQHAPHLLAMVPT